MKRLLYGLSACPSIIGLIELNHSERNGPINFRNCAKRGASELRKKVASNSIVIVLPQIEAKKNEEQNGKSRSVQVSSVTANLIGFLTDNSLSTCFFFFRWEGGETDCESDSGGDVPDLVCVHSGDRPSHHCFLLHVS